MRNRLTYICCLLASLFLLNNVPGFFTGASALAVAGMLALAVWVTGWLRLYYVKSLRPEFAILLVVPQLAAYAAIFAGEEALTHFNSAFYHNIYALLWIAAAFVGIRTMRAGEWEKPKGRKDTVYIMMSILTALYSFFCCASFFVRIFPQ